MNKNNIFSVVVFFSFMLFISACTDLDTLPAGDKLTDSQKEEAYDRLPERTEAGVNAIFAQFNQYMPNATALGASRHNDFGYPSIMLFTDASGMDVVSEDNGYNWTANSMEFSDRSYTSNEAQIIWNNFYSIIFGSNKVAASIDPETEEASAKFNLAQALSVRAFGYFGLVQMYQFNYVGNQTKPAVPLITEKNTEESRTEGLARATVQQVYDQILSDLDASINLLEEAKEAKVDRRDKRYVDLAVAYGLRARVHLTMQKWAEALSDAENAIASTKAVPGGLKDVNKPTFMNAGEKNWMWGIIVAETDRVVTSGIVNWYSHMGSFNGNGYSTVSKGKQINKALYESIPNTDVRKGWWLNSSKVSENLTAKQQEFVDETGYAAYTQVKFAPYKDEVGTSTNANDIPLMRVEEMYLIKAEAEGMISGTATALESFVKTYRNPTYKVRGSSKEDIQEAVYQQRRIELWGEGLNWYDIMRLNKAVDRRGGGYPNATMIFNIPAGSDILLWRIPEAEIQANPALSESDNNPSASAPVPVKEN